MLILPRERTLVLKIQYMANLTGSSREHVWHRVVVYLVSRNDVTRVRVHYTCERHCAAVRLTASRRLEETDRHVAPARSRGVSGAWSVAGSASVAVEVSVRLALRDFAAGAPTPTVSQQQAEERKVVIFIVSERLGHDP